MKITDTLGRTLDVDIVVKATMFDGWMEPLGYTLENNGVAFKRVPRGAFALRLISQLGADVLVHLDGKQLLATSVAQGIQYLEQGLDGKPFYFGAEAVHSQGDTADDITTHAPLVAPEGHGLLFVVARFADDPTIVGDQPPRQEYEITFQLQAPEDHDRSLAGNLSKVVEPPLPDDPDDIVKMTPSNSPTFVCSIKSHRH